MTRGWSRRGFEQHEFPGQQLKAAGILEWNWNLEVEVILLATAQLMLFKNSHWSP